MLDAWVIYQLFERDIAGNRVGESVTFANSAWEIAIMEDGFDFMGCLHGHHLASATTMYVDGVATSMAAPATHAATENVNIVQTSAIHLWSDDSKVADIETSWTWTKGSSLVQRTTASWVQNLVTSYAYLGMFPVVRVKDGKQFTDAAIFHPSQAKYDVSVTGHAAGGGTNQTGVLITGPTAGFNISHSVVGTTLQWAQVSDDANYNKVYENYSVGITAGDYWDAEVIYTAL